MIDANAPLAVQASKRVIHLSLALGTPFEAQAWELSDSEARTNIRSEDAREGPRASAEKRAAVAGPMTSAGSMSGATAVAGMGLTDVGTVYGRSATDFAADAVRRAAADAGLSITDIDGLLVAPAPPADSAHDGAREHRILSALQDTDVPVPAVFGLCRDPAVADAPVLLMEFVDGMVVDRMSVAESLSPARRRTIGLSMPTALAVTPWPTSGPCSPTGPSRARTPATASPRPPSTGIPLLTPGPGAASWAWFRLRAERSSR